jgi:hypothetical protein
MVQPQEFRVGAARREAAAGAREFPVLGAKRSHYSQRRERGRITAWLILYRKRGWTCDERIQYHAKISNSCPFGEAPGVNILCVYHAKCRVFCPLP